MTYRPGRDGVALNEPVPEVLGDLCEALLDAGPALRAIPLRERAERLERALGILADLPVDEHRALADEAEVSPEAMAWELAQAAQTWGDGALIRWFERDVGPIQLLERWSPREGRTHWRAFGPRLLFHIQAGNVGAPGIEGVLCALFLGSPCLVKLPSGPAGAVLACLHRTLMELSPALAAALGQVRWPGGTLELEATAFRFADVVLFHGGDAALMDLRARIPPEVRILSHPHRLSVAYVDASRRGDADLPRALVEDIIRYDQRGCLSPRGIFVEGGWADALALGERLHVALGDPSLPIPGDPPLRSQAEVAQARGRLAFSGRVLGGLHHTVAVEPGAFVPAPAARFALLLPTEGLDATLRALRRYRHRLQGVALAVDPDTRMEVAERLAAEGVPYVTDVGTIQRPVAGWPADGRPLMGDLVRISALSDQAMGEGER